MYSQNAEEAIILHYFAGQTGVFLDLGAYDGVHISNTRALAERGWAGFAVEPSPVHFERLEKNCRGFPIQLFNVAIDKEDGFVIFYDSPDGLSGTLISRDTGKWCELASYVPVEVTCVTIAKLLSLINCEKIDMISCDIEGLDLTAMAELPFEKLGTRLVVVEWNGIRYQEFSDILSKRFYLAYTSPENMIWMLRTTADDQDVMLRELAVLQKELNTPIHPDNPIAQGTYGQPSTPGLGLAEDSQIINHDHARPQRASLQDSIYFLVHSRLYSSAVIVSV